MENENQQSAGQTKKCPKCGELIQASATKCKHCGADLRNWFVKHKIITGILILIVIGIIASMAGGESNKQSNSNSTATVNESSPKTEEKAETSEEKSAPAKDVTVPAEYKSALNKATTYANTMHMSKQGVYNQLVSEYGEKFSTVAAQYAIDNMKADWDANALAKAKTYQDTMSMSPVAIHDQLTSEYGEKFTKAEADYAIQYLND